MIDKAGGGSIGGYMDVHGTSLKAGRRYVYGVWMVDRERV